MVKLGYLINGYNIYDSYDNILLKSFKSKLVFQLRNLGLFDGCKLIFWINSSTLRFDVIQYIKWWVKLVIDKKRKILLVEEQALLWVNFAMKKTVY